MASDPGEARELLTEAKNDVDAAQRAGLPASAVDPVRAEVVAGFDRLFGMVVVEDRVVFEFDEAADPPFDLGALIRGPDGVPYVLDRATRAVWRVNLRDERAAQVIGQGTEADGGTVGEPRLIATGGRELLVLDTDNALWAWEPGEEEGEGTTRLVELDDSGDWGEIVAMGTTLENAEERLYRLFVADVSERQIRTYAPDPDGGVQSEGEGWLAEPRPLDGVTQLYADEAVWLLDDGGVVRFAGGEEDGWAPAPPGDEVIRGAPRYRLINAPTPAADVPVYLLDAANLRVLAFSKEDGQLQEQYRLADGNENWADMRGLYVALGRDGAPSIMVWNTARDIRFSRLEPDDPPASPAPDASGASPAASPAASAAP